MQNIRLALMLTAMFFLASCGGNGEEKALTKEEKAKQKTEDSLALKVGVTPTLDCLPLFVAKEREMFGKHGADIRLKGFSNRMDCDKAMEKGKTEASMTDIVRAEFMSRNGTSLEYITQTDAYWQIVSNRKARITSLKQMTDKMLAMARLSATDMLGDIAVDSAKMRPEYVFRVQINDDNLRLKMLLNNEMDAAVLTEPQATTARLYKNYVLMDSRDRDIRLGAMVADRKRTADKRRRKQIEALRLAYNEAVDSINKYGLRAYGEIIKKYTKADDKTVDALPETRFQRTAAPREKDIRRAQEWLK